MRGRGGWTVEETIFSLESCTSQAEARVVRSMLILHDDKGDDKRKTNQYNFLRMRRGSNNERSDLQPPSSGLSAKAKFLWLVHNGSRGIAVCILIQRKAKKKLDGNS